MSQLPPFAQPLNLPYDFPGLPKGIPTSGGFNPNAKGPALSVPVHEPALGSMTPAQTVQLPMSAAPAVSNTNTAASAPPDYMQLALQANQKLIDNPYKQPEYHPPAKGLEYLAAGLSLLFPGAPISYAASGLAQGLYQRSQEQYARAETAEQQRVAGLEKTAQVESTMADQQAAIQQRREAVDQRHADMLSSLQEKMREFNQAFPLKVASLQFKMRDETQKLALMASRNTITQEDAQLQASTRYQVAVMQQAGLDRRNMNNNRLRSVIAQAQSATTQTDQQLKALDTAVTASGGDPATVAKTQAQASQLIAANQQHVASLLNEASSLDPQLGSAGTLQSIGTPTQQNPYGWPPANAATAGTGTTTNNYYYGPKAGAGIPHESDTLKTNTTATEPFPAFPTLGHGQGVDDATLKTMSDIATQHANALPDENAVLAQIAASNVAAELSAQQVQHIVNVWSNTRHAHDAQKANPAAASVKGATAQPPAPSGYAADSGSPVQTPGWLSNIVHGVENTLNAWNTPPQQSQPQLSTTSAHPHAPSGQHIQKTGERAPMTVLGAITNAAQEVKLPSQGIALLRAMMQAESGGNQGAVSDKGAVGRFQLEPSTAASLGVDPNDPYGNILGGAKYIKQQLDRFHSIPLALAAYNAGPGAVEKYHGVPPYPETQAYVRKVMALYAQLTSGR